MNTVEESRIPKKLSETLRYHYSTLAADGATYSCDKIILEYKQRADSLDKLFGLLGVWEPEGATVAHWQTFRVGSFRDQFTFTLHDGNSFWLGCGLNAYPKPLFNRCRLEFNPNKVGDTWVLRWVLERLWNGAQRKPEVRRFDFAADYAITREQLRLCKDARLYEEYSRGRADRTQYLGQRNTHGRCKLYNKQVESKLTTPCSRLEITVDTADGGSAPSSVAGLWPKVYNVAPVQLVAQPLNETDSFIFYTLLDAPERIRELGRRKREKMEQLISATTGTLRFDSAAYARLLENINEWANTPTYELKKGGISDGTIIQGYTMCCE